MSFQYCLSSLITGWACLPCCLTAYQAGHVQKQTHHLIHQTGSSLRIPYYHLPRHWDLRPGAILQFSTVAQSSPTLCNPVNHRTPGLDVHYQLPEFTQTHVHWVGDAIQPSHPLSSPSPPAFTLSQHQGHFKWVSSSHQVAKVLEFQLQNQSFQWTPRTDLL